MAQWYVTVYIKKPFARILLMIPFFITVMPITRKKAMAIFLTELSLLHVNQIKYAISGLRERDSSEVPLSIYFIRAWKGILNKLGLLV